MESLFGHAERSISMKKERCRTITLFNFRNRFLVTVICCSIYHWLEVSGEVDFLQCEAPVIKSLTTDILGNKSLVSKTLFQF